MPLRVQVKRALTGSYVTDSEENPLVLDLEPYLEQSWLDVKKNIAELIERCVCKLKLMADKQVMRDGLKVKRMVKSIKSEYVLKLIECAIPTTTAADLHERGICLRCMKEAGIGAKEIITCDEIQATALQLRGAGFSLADLVHCFPPYHHSRRIHPPVTRLTLFDSQLKEAGYSARDFRAADYNAETLSEEYFYHDPYGEGLTPGDLEWWECCAFFNARELKEAGYSARELKSAFFSAHDLKEAGLSETDLKEAGFEEQELSSVRQPEAKKMPRPDQRPKAKKTPKRRRCR